MCMKKLVSENPQHVVVLEDDTSLIDVYRDLFKKYQKINVTYFENADNNFVNYINTLPVDLFIVDIVLNQPDPDGIKIAENILNKKDDSVFLFVSGYDYNLSSLSHLEGKCIYDFMSKPFDMEEFLVTVHTLLNISKTYQNTIKRTCTIDEIREEYWDMINAERAMINKLVGSDVFK